MYVCICVVSIRSNMFPKVSSESSSSSPLLYALSDSDQQPNYIILHPIYTRKRNTLGITLTITLAFFFIISIFLLFPSDPKLSLARIRINRINIRTLPHISLDLSLSLTLRIRNRDFFSFNYSSLEVSVGYRGKKLGFASSQGGNIRPRGTSYLNATLDLDGLEVIHDVVYLLADLAKGSVPFDTDSEVKGTVGILFLHFPIRGRVACELFVNTRNQTIMHQDCHPE